MSPACWSPTAIVFQFLFLRTFPRSIALNVSGTDIPASCSKIDKVIAPVRWENLSVKIQEFLSSNALRVLQLASDLKPIL